jgi:cob(I)alamin adenosyltransferase
VPIYTKLGDRGETRLFDGTRVMKDDPRVEAYGQVDELNAAIGAAHAFIRDDEIGRCLVTLQKHLLALGAELANPEAGSGPEKGRLDPAWVGDLEGWIDAHQEQLPPLRRFILSGGGAGGAMLHLARTVCRRAERNVIGLSETSDVAPAVIEYLNRLSDLLFVLARAINHREGLEEIPW